MGFLKVDVNTSPIPPYVTVPRPFQSPSGGSGGGGDTYNVYADGVNAGGLETLGPTAVGPGAEVDLLVFPFTFAGGLPYMLLASLVLPAVTGPCTVKAYVDGVLQLAVPYAAGGSFNYQKISGTVSPVGAVPIRLALENIGVAPIAVGARTLSVMEFE